MKAVAAIKKFMESEPNGRKVTMDELRNLDTSARQELGAMCCGALGEPFESNDADAKAA